MGRQRDSKITGTFGNLIFYNHHGDYRMRTKPVKVRRSAASIKSGFNFGKASKLSKQIRDLVASINPCKSESRVGYRLIGALNRFISWKEKQKTVTEDLLQKLPFIEGFQFNEKSDLSSIHAIKASVNAKAGENIEINLAPFMPTDSLHAPSSANHIVFEILVITTDLNILKSDEIGKTEIKIPYSREWFQPPVINTNSFGKPGDLLLIILSVKYMVDKNGRIEQRKDPKKRPCGILWAGHLP